MSRPVDLYAPVPRARRSQSPRTVDVPEEVFAPSVSIRIQPRTHTVRDKTISRFLSYVGPGVMISVAYMDPGNIGAAVNARSQPLYTILWTLLLRTLLGFVLQSRAANLGVVTGQNLAQQCRAQYPRHVRVVLWLMTELALLFGDWQEVLGTSIALHVISHQLIPLWAGVPISIVTTFLLLQLERMGIRFLEGLFGASILLMGILFGVLYTKASPPQGAVLKGIFAPLVPSGAGDFALATVGSAIVPHNIYFHSTLVLSRRIDRKSNDAVRESIISNTVETALALLVSVVINIFVVCVFAAMDYTSCGSRDDVILLNASSCLVQNYGAWTLYIFAAALIISGQISTCHGAYTGGFVLQGLMHIELSGIMRTIICRAISVGPAIAIAIYANDVENAKLIQGWLNVVQALQLPLVLIPLLTCTMSWRVMGRFADSIPMRIVCIATSLLLVCINYYFAFPFIVASLPCKAWTHVILCVLFVAYTGFIVHLLLLCLGGIARVYSFLRTDMWSASIYDPSAMARPDAALTQAADVNEEWTQEYVSPAAQSSVSRTHAPSSAERDIFDLIEDLL